MDLIVYGTLRCRALMATVAGDGPLNGQMARLEGFDVRCVAGQVVPCILRGAGTAQGLLWSGLTHAQTRRLDLYEGAFGYTLKTVTVIVDGEAQAAQCYLPPEDVLVADGDWDLADWEDKHLAPALLAAAELFRCDPLPTPSTLRSMWPMIEARAWSKHRAELTASNVRSNLGTDAFAIAPNGPAAGSFFRFQAFDVQHRRFDGRKSPALHREGFIGVDAAIILPYDPKRDKVLLVEQFRLGPAARHDPNPWVLEAVAGIVDARETPQQAAMREAREEAGLDIVSFETAGGYYPSPGATTDYFHHFVGLCDLPATAPYQGGLADEHEDLKLHPMSFDDAMALMQSGEINVGPLCYLLYWLAAHRDRLRETS